MEVKTSKHTIEISSDEAFDIACDIKHAFIYTVKTHWINFPNSWKNNEETRMKRMKYFFELGNNARHFGYAIEEAEKIISEFKEQQKIKVVV